MHILDNRGEVWKTIVVLVPILGASMIGISRIMDARHHPFDVLSSSILGMFVAWVSYRQYFPSISDTRNKGYAYPIRSWGTESPPPLGPAFTRAPDEEDGDRIYGNKLGRAPASGVPVVGGGGSPEQRRRPNQPDSTIPAASGERDYSTGGAFEMRDRKVVDTAYQPYSGGSTGPPRTGSHSTDSNETDDYRWGVASATSALGGDRLAYTPIGESRASRKTMESNDNGFVQVQPAPRGVELKDDGARGS